MVLGPLADHLGPRKTLVACLTLAASAVAMFGSSDSFQVLLFQLFLCGAALGPMWPSCSKALACWFPNRVSCQLCLFHMSSSSKCLLRFTVRADRATRCSAFSPRPDWWAASVAPPWPSRSRTPTDGVISTLCLRLWYSFDLLTIRQFCIAE